MPALAIALFVWQDQFCRAIMVVTTLHSLVNISELVFKSVFEKRPALPKYSSTWDVDIVLQYLELHYPQDELTLKELACKIN